MITLIFVGVIIGVLVAGWFNVGQWDVIVLSMAIAPIALASSWERNTGGHSIFFTQHLTFFRLISLVLEIALLWGLYKYFLIFGLLKTTLVFIASMLVQGPFYAFLKLKIGMEVLIYPIALIGVLLFFCFAL